LLASGPIDEQERSPEASTNPSGRSSNGAAAGNWALVRTVRQTASPLGSAVTPCAITCAGPLAGENPGSASWAAPKCTEEKENTSAATSANALSRRHLYRVILRHEESRLGIAIARNERDSSPLGSE